MSFTITCDKCGNKQVFHDDDNPIGDNIEVSVTERYSYSGCEVISKDISCSNFACNNEVNL